VSLIKCIRRETASRAANAKTYVKIDTWLADRDANWIWVTAFEVLIRDDPELATMFKLQFGV
jgi:hypothetical protein